MKLQWAFGNPRGKKKRKKAKKAKKTGRKGIAKKRKKGKHKRVKHKLKKAIKHMAKKKHKKRSKVAKRKFGRRKRKNPAHMLAFKTKDGKKKLVGSATFLLAHEIKKKIDSDKSVKRFKNMLDKAKDPGEKSMLANKLIKLKQIKAGKYNLDKAQKEKYMARLQEEGAEIKHSISQEKAKVAKKGKKPAKKKPAKKKPKKAAKKAAKKVTKKVTKKAVKKKTQKRKSKKRYKMITHTHAKSTRHIRRGAKAMFSSRKRKGSFKIKAKFGKGKKKVTMTGRARVSKKGILSGLFKINPFRSNPMKERKTTAEKYLGISGAEAGALVAAAAATPFVKKGIVWATDKIGLGSTIAPYLDTLAPILGGIALNASVEHGLMKKVPVLDKQEGLVQHFADAMVLIGLVKGAFTIADMAMKATGMAGVNYTPTMRGMGIVPQLNGMGDVRYTPNMRGVNYTPTMRGMGEGADFGSADYGGNAGYTQSHKSSRADFGAYQSQDSEAEGLDEQENSYSSSMN